MRLFVTGATGFLGSHICYYSSVDTVGLVRDILPSSWIDDALSKCVRVRGDVRDLSLIRRVLAQYSIDTVIHTAALARVKTANIDPLTTYDVNIMGTVNILEASRLSNVQNIVVIQTDKIYGNAMEANTKSPFLHSGPYETSKAVSAMICEQYREFYGLDVLMPVASNLYGYDPFSDRVIPNTIKMCMSGETPFIYKETAKMLRQYIFVDDFLAAITWAVKHHNKPMLPSLYPESLYHRDAIWNVPGENKTQEEVVLEICKHFGVEPTYIEGKRTRELMFTTMQRSVIGDLTITPFSEGIRKTIDLFRKYGIPFQIFT